MAGNTSCATRDRRRIWIADLGLAALLAAACGQTPRAAPVVVAAATAARAEAPLPATVPAPRDDGRLPPGVRPRSYALDLTVDPTLPTFGGRARIAVTLDGPTRAIVMHGRALAVRTALVTSAGVSQPARAWPRLAAHDRGEPDELALTFDQLAGPGPAVIDIEYQAPFSPGLDGVYRVEEGGAPYAFTQFEPTDARRAFPCFDEPGWKTPFSLTLTVPRGLEAFANSKLARRADSADGHTTFTFEPTPPLPTYLVAFAVGTFDVRDGPRAPAPIRLVAARGKGDLGALSIDAAAAHLTLLGQYFDRPYPYSKLDLVAVPNFGAGAMENAGFITFREELLLLDPAHASTASRRAMASVIAHELAHQWFGDLVTMAWWDDVWLNEAFANWMADKIVDQWRPESRARVKAIGDKAQVMAEDALASARRIRNPVRSSGEAEEAFDGITYGKGRAVLNMIEAWLGEDTFRDGLRRYIKAHEWGNASAPDLYKALADASGVREVAAVMDSFTEQTGVPLISASLRCQPARDAAGTTAVIAFTEREYRTLDRAGPSEKTWRIPLCAAFPVAGHLQRRCMLMDGAQAEMALPGAGCPAFFYPNAGETGYYRFQLAPADARRLANGLNQLSEQERFGVVNNSWASVWSGELPAASFLELLRGFRNEDSRLVWGQIAESLAELDRAAITDGARPAFAAYVRDLLGPLGRRLGFTAKAGETDDQKILRDAVMDALGNLGDDGWVLSQARRATDAWLADAASTDADIARLAVPLAARHGDAALYDRLLAVARSPKTPELRVVALRGLAAFEDPAQVARTLELVASGGIKTQDLRYTFVPLATRRSTQNATIAWIEGNYARLAAAVPDPQRARFMGVAGALCDRERVQSVAAFLRPRIEALEGADKSIRQSIEQGLRCAMLREKEAPATTQWLAQHRL
ncbi:MAG TPA: M1 family metallopeptidase [Polyangia bacterium]|nr:M1 family metallopeptidase [Polyangia bacterium]